MHRSGASGASFLFPYDPPATAGRSKIFEVEVTVVSSPLSRRMSSPSTNTFRKLGTPSPSSTRARQRRELHDQCVQCLTHGARLDVDETLPAGVRAQHRWDPDLSHCFKRYSKGG